MPTYEIEKNSSTISAYFRAKRQNSWDDGAVRVLPVTIL